MNKTEALPPRQLFSHIKSLLCRLYEEPDNHLVFTLALMVTGLFLGDHVQFWQIALRVPIDVQLTGIVRRFERFVAALHDFFKPFVFAMQASLGHETAILIIDCTRAGRKCRTVMIGLAYHGTVLPIVWKTVKGTKGHVKGEIQRALLEQAYVYFRYHKRVVVLGDAEYSNEQVISWLLEVKWDLVLRFQSNYLLQIGQNDAWQSARSRHEAANVPADQVCYWEKVTFTRSHQFTDLTVSVQWAENESEPLCLISSLPASAQPHLIYAQRFWVETLFGNHKSRGFQLARTHMTDPEHIDRLVLAIAIATCLTLGLGTHLILIEKTNLVDRSDRRDLSLFQLGWRWFFRLLALDRLREFKMRFSWDFKLPPAGFQPAS